MRSFIFGSLKILDGLNRGLNPQWLEAFEFHRPAPRRLPFPVPASTAPAGESVLVVPRPVVGVGQTSCCPRTAAFGMPSVASPRPPSATLEAGEDRPVDSKR